MRRWGPWAAAMIAAAWITSCGGGGATDEGAAATTTGDEAAEEGVPSPPEPWETMSHDDRAAWMFAEVMPRMRDRFQGFDAERYAGFGCATCHGPSPEERGFAMPSAALPALYPTGSPEQHQMVREYPEMVRFMFNDVLPTMQTLVGAPDFDEATGEGFSCYACHPHAGDEGTTPVSLSGGDAGTDATAPEAP